MNLKKTRSYAITLSREEVLDALKAAHPKVPLIQSIPTGKDGATLTLSGSAVTIKWTRDDKAALTSADV